MRGSHLFLYVLLLAGLIGCNPFVQQLPTPEPFTLVPTSILPTETPRATLALPTSTSVLLQPSPTISVTVTPPSGGVAQGTPAGPRRIQFESRAISSTVEANLQTNAIDTYTLRALAGQTMTVMATSTQAHLLLQISGADGNPLKSMAAGGPNWSGVLPKTQDYLIAITTADGSAASYTLQVTIPPPAR